MSRDPHRLVREGYDAVAGRYLEWNRAIDSPAEQRFVPLVLESLPAGSRVLDLGCGNGLPRTRMLAERFRVVAVDFSAAQLALTRVNAPWVTAVQADMAALHFHPASFDAVVAFYSIIHVPREEQSAVFGRIAEWLRPGGLFVASLAAGDDPGTVEEGWLGAPMYWSGFDPETSERMVRDAGFQIELGEVIPQIEDREEVSFLWIVARRHESERRPNQWSETD